MNRRRSSKHREPRPGSRRTSGGTGNPAAGESTLGRWTPAGLLGGLAGLLVATVLQPTEGNWQDGSQALPALIWCALLALTAGAQLLKLIPPLRWTGLEISFVALAAWIGIASLAGVTRGLAEPRGTWNVMWVWLSLIAGFLVIRQLVRSASLRRQLLLLGLGIGLFLAVGGIYQYFVELPQARADYFEASETEKQAILQRARVPEVEPGSRLRMLFENRLRSTEPLATFGLANSLAAVLSTWLVVLAGLGLARWLPHSSQPPAGDSPGRLGWLAWSLAGLALAVCLLLTKSRTAWLAAATLLGLSLAWFAAHRRRGRQGVGLALLAAVLGGGLAAAGFAVGWLDREVITEAWKSMQYRVEYWQATLAMIADAPVTGVSPGSFQDVYTHYKLPGTSESVADPHNGLLELLATCGLVTLLPLLAIVGATLRQWWHRGWLSSTGDRPAETAFKGGNRSADSPEPAGLGLWIGAAAGVLVGLILGAGQGYQMELGMLLVGLAVTVPVLWLLQRWRRAKFAVAPLAAAGWLTWLLNLSAAGGIGYLAVAQFGILLLALSLPPLPEASSLRAAQRVAGGQLIVAILLAIGVQQTFLLPVSRAQWLILDAENAMATERFDEAEKWLLAAAEADPWSAEPWRLLAYASFLRWQRTQTAASWEQFESAVERELALRPQASQLYREAGLWYLQAYGRSGRVEQLERALELWQLALETYPHEAWLWAEYAYLLDQAERPEAARDAAEEALRLDALTPHADLKLANRPLRLVSGQLSDRATEQQLRELRNR